MPKILLISKLMESIFEDIHSDAGYEMACELLYITKENCTLVDLQNNIEVNFVYEQIF